MSLTTLDNLYPHDHSVTFLRNPTSLIRLCSDKNNHYIIVDVPIFLLHYAAVSPIGSAAKGVMNRLGKPSRCSRM